MTLAKRLTFMTPPAADQACLLPRFGTQTNSHRSVLKTGGLVSGLQADLQNVASMVPGKWRIAFLAAAKTLDESELSGPIRTLKQAGACVDVIGADEDEIRVFRHDAAGATERIAIGVARPFDQVSPREMTPWFCLPL